MQNTGSVSQTSQPQNVDQKHMANELILKIGAEGGSLTLYGNRDLGHWRFSRTVIDGSGELVGLPPSRSDSQIVDTIEEALMLLDRYPWQALYPLEIHPEFCDAIIAAARERAASRRQSRPFDEDTWRSACRNRPGDR